MSEATKRRRELLASLQQSAEQIYLHNRKGTLMRHYVSPNSGIEAWRVSWIIHGPRNGNSPRARLAAELKYIRRAFGQAEARRYRDNLLWVGSYPSR